MGGSALSKDRVGWRRMAGLTVAAMATILLASQAAQADTILWTADTDRWDIAANWDLLRLPLANDDAYIRNNGTAQAVATGATAANVYVGLTGGNKGHIVVTPTGSLTIGGSALDVPGRLTISTDIDGGSMTVAGGGTVSNTDGFIGFNATGNGTATVKDAGSTWTNSGILRVGNEGTGTLDVLNGGSVSNTTGYLGYDSTGDGTAMVDGAGSTWTNAGQLYVGRYGTGTLNVLNGGSVSIWTNTSTLYVGYQGTGTLNVLNGGSVSNRYCYLGAYSTGSGTATVDGDDSTWTSSGYLTVGERGTGALIVQNGGSVSSMDGYIGENTTGSGTATVDGDGSTWATSALTVGALGTGTLNVLNGGRVSNTWSWIGDYITASGTATVDGAGSTWTNSEDLIVGFGGTGTLSIQNGGSVSNANCYLGLVGGSSGTVTVDGAGSLWSISSWLCVAGARYSSEGSSGHVTVSNGGELSVGDMLMLWPGGFLTVQGGTVQAAELVVHAGATGNLLSGTTTVGAVSGGGTLNYQGGTLNVTGPAGLALGPGEPLGSTLTLNGSQTLNVTNQMTVPLGSILTVGPGAGFTVGSMSNAGTTLVLTPSVNLGSGLTNTGDAMFMGTTVAGPLYTPTGSTVTVLGTVTFNDAVSGAGTFWGPGTTVFNGGYNPGDSPAITTFEGSVVLGATNQLLMELAGLAPGTGYDQVNILGDLTLGGELEVLVDRVFRGLIEPSDTFTLLSAAGEVTGEFLNVAPGGRLQSEDLLSEFTVYYGPGSPYGAQFVVLSNFAAIPEPATLTLLALGGLGLLRRRRREH